jgi:hypothetical protein
MVNWCLVPRALLSLERAIDDKQIASRLARWRLATDSDSIDKSGATSPPPAGGPLAARYRYPPPHAAPRTCRTTASNQSMTMPPTLPVDADSPARNPSDDEYGTHRGGVDDDDDDDDDEFEASRETNDDEEVGMSGQ